MNTLAQEKRAYKHLSFAERTQIAVLRKEQLSISRIAQSLNRNKSTISREIKRGRDKRYHKEIYIGELAQKKSEQTSREAHAKERLTPAIREYAENKLKEGLSPELIAGRIKIDLGIKTNHESIYQWIYTERRELIPYLAKSHKKRRKRKSKSGKNRSKIPHRIDIDQRDESIESRKQAGHWEADTALSRSSKAVLAVLVERKTRRLCTGLLKRGQAEPMHDFLVDSLKDLPPLMRQSITYDNDSENAAHQKVNQKLNTQSFFCKPYHSWEKGSVENTIGMLRRFWPKKTDWLSISIEELRRVEQWYNNRPKKCLGFLTPQEAWNKEMSALGEKMLE